MAPTDTTSARGSHNLIARSRGLVLVLGVGFCLLPLDAFAIKISNINKPVQAPAGPQLKSGFLPPACGKDPVKSPMLLDCWLNYFPYKTPGYDIKFAIAWEASPGTTLSWPQWEDWRKGDLRRAFKAAWMWHDSGFKSFPGLPLPEPLPNQLMLADGDGVATLLDESTQAWPMYIAYVAQSLAAELGAWVPWSLRSYDTPGSNPNALQDVLSAWGWFKRVSDNPNDNYYWPTPGYWVAENSLPAHPTFAFSFLKTNGLIAPTHYKTLGNVLNWSRNLAHYFGAPTALNMENHWGYRGLPPASMVITGTILTDLQWGPFPDPEHWTAGCWGTTAFLRSVLRTINIPMEARSSLETCGHTMPYFPSLGRYLSHGDDPYTYVDRQATYPAEQLLIDEATWHSWFLSGDLDASCTNVGRRPTELAVWEFSPPLYHEYCFDLATNKDHASGNLYALFEPYFSVQDLEATNLWQRIDTAVQAAGGCAQFYP